MEHHHNALLFFNLFSEKLVVVLRDGKTLIGYLRSIDQFGKQTLLLYCILLAFNNNDNKIIIIVFIYIAHT